MEPGVYFATLVFAVAALHLIARGVNSFRRTFKSSQPGSGKKVTKRSDWYMFFHCSDLTGEKTQPTLPKTNGRNISTSTKKNSRKDSRQSLRRHRA